MAKAKKSRQIPFSTEDIANIARSNPVIQQLLSDPKLRKNVRTALASSKLAYGRLSNGKVPARALLEDRRLHSHLGRALGAAREVTITVSRAQRKRTRRGISFGRALVIGGVGSGIIVATNQKLRSKILDALFGAEEEFQYTPPTNSTTADSSTTVGAA